MFTILGTWILLRISLLWGCQTYQSWGHTFGLVARDWALVQACFWLCYLLSGWQKCEGILQDAHSTQNYSMPLSAWWTEISWNHEWNKSYFHEVISIRYFIIAIKKWLAHSQIFLDFKQRRFLCPKHMWKFINHNKLYFLIYTILK